MSTTSWSAWRLARQLPAIDLSILKLLPDAKRSFERPPHDERGFEAQHAIAGTAKLLVAEEGVGLHAVREPPKARAPTETADHAVGSTWIIRTPAGGNVRLRARAREGATESTGNLSSGSVVTVIRASDPATERDARANGFVAVRGDVGGGRVAAGFVHVRHLVAEAQRPTPALEAPLVFEFDTQPGTTPSANIEGTLGGSVRELPDYIDNRVEAVGVGLLLGGYLLFVSGLDQPLFLPEAWVKRAEHGATGLEAIHHDRDEALATLQGQAHQFTYSASDERRRRRGPWRCPKSLGRGADDFWRATGERSHRRAAAARFRG